MGTRVMVDMGWWTQEVFISRCILRADPEVFVYGGDVGCDQNWPEQPEVGSTFPLMGTSK